MHPWEEETTAHNMTSNTDAILGKMLKEREETEYLSDYSDSPLSDADCSQLSDEKPTATMDALAIKILT